MADHIQQDKGERKLIVSDQGSGIAGGIGFGMRTTDWYNDSEFYENELCPEEIHMCFIPTPDAMCRQVHIADDPDPNDTFSMKLRGKYRALNNLGSTGSPDIYKHVEVRMFIDQSELPIIVSSFSADGKVAICETPVIGSYAEGSFSNPMNAKEVDDEKEPVFYIPKRDAENCLVLNVNGEQEMMPVLYYKCRFKVVALRPNPFPPRVGAAALYLDAPVLPSSEPRYRASVVIKTNFLKNAAGLYPEKAYLRLVKKAVQDDREFYLDYIPATPLKSLSENAAEAAYGMVTFEVDDLEPGTEYFAYIEEIAPTSSDSPSIKERKTRLLQLLGDSAAFATLRKYNRGNLDGAGDDYESIFKASIERGLGDSTTPGLTSDQIKVLQIAFWTANVIEQSAKVTRFITPPAPTDTKTCISFSVGSCFGGTNRAYKKVNRLKLHFSVEDGDKFYADNVRNTESAQSDFYACHATWLRNKYTQLLISSSSLITLSDDHECADNWFRNIFISGFNMDHFYLTPEQRAIYDKMMAIPSIRARIITRLTNQYPYTLAPLNRINAANEANNMFWPNAPGRIDAVNKAENGSFRVRYGAMNVIVLNSNPEVNQNGSVNYNAVEGTWTPGVPPAPDTFTKPTGETRFNFIPPTSLAFLKRILLEESNGTNPNPAICHSVFFSSDIAPLFRKYYDIMKAQNRLDAIAAIKAADPNATISEEAISEMFDRKFAASEYDSPDNYPGQLLPFEVWLTEMKIRNLFFWTGDPHSALVKYLNKKNVIVSACISSVSTYRASGANLTLATNLDADDTILALSNNAYGHGEFDPVNMTMGITLRYGDEIRGRAVIPLSKKNSGYSKKRKQQHVAEQAAAPSSGWFGKLIVF